jgi:hypothetical protein
MRIVSFFIYQVVTSSGGNISGTGVPGLCSKVLGILNFPASLAATLAHPEHLVTRNETTVATGEEYYRQINCQPSPLAAKSLVLAGDCAVLRRPNHTIRQQFLSALHEDCSFFAHLVLRCVRGRDRSPHGVAAPRGAKPRPVSGAQRKTQHVTRSYAQRKLEDLPTAAGEASFLELETLWVEVASRQVHISVCEGGRS